MATGDKLVTLDGLKAVYDHLDGVDSSLKSAVKFDADGETTIDITDYSVTECIVASSNKLAHNNSQGYMSRQIPREPAWAYVSVTAREDFSANITFVKTALPASPSNGTPVSTYLATGETGRHMIDQAETGTLAIPADTAYIVIATVSNSATSAPASVKPMTKLGGGKQDKLIFDATPTKNSVNPVTSGGVEAAIRNITDQLTYPFEAFIQKNINATTGVLSDTNADKSITNNDLIRPEYIYRITSNYNNIRFYKYDSAGAFLGNTTLGKTTITAANMQAFIADNPTTKFLRVKIGTADDPASIDPESQYYWADNGVSLILFEHDDGPVEDPGLVTFESISYYGTNGVFESDGENPLTFTVKIPYNGDKRNQIFTCIAKYTQEEGVTVVPTVTFYTAGSTNNLKRTTPYTIGGKDNFETKQWRVIRYPGNTAYAAAVFNIPVGVTCTIKDFYNEYSDRIDRHPYGIRINGHRAFPTTPEDTMPGVEMAIKSGACAMIEIPKRLSDGVWIFYHDDSLVYNDTYIRQADGTELPSTYNGTLWSAIDSATAFSWDWGVSTGALFAGLKPMRMEEFFLACGKAGIMPMLSMHPWPSSAELGEIKAIARKCGVLRLLGIKCSTARIAEAYAAFGNDIESYTIDVSSGSQTQETVEAAVTAMSGLTGCTARRVIELFASTAYNAYCNETEASRYDAFKLISDAGFGCSIAQQTGSYHPTLPNGAGVIMKSTDVDYWISKGVTEFTYEYNWSTGLNW